MIFRAFLLLLLPLLAVAPVALANVESAHATSEPTHANSNPAPANSGPAHANSLARPASLQPAIDFWRRVYTEITTDEGFIHDDERLDIVYETVRLSSSDNRARRATARHATERYVHALKAVAGGKRDHLDAAEQRVVALWGPNIDAKALTRAAQRVRFQLGQADKFRAGLIRSGAWRQFIRKTITDAGLPQEIASLPHVESSFNPAAYSKVGAAGMWQFMRSTGRRFMRIDNVVDERLDPYKSTVAAALLMQQNYEVTGTWPLAITAYNHGAAGMRRAIAQVGSNDIAVIVRKYNSRSFGFASRNFYAALLAAVDIDDDPAHYFGVFDRHPQDSSRVMVMPHFVDASTLVKSLGVREQVLEEINPSLRATVWNGSKKVPKGYELRVPLSAGNPKILLASVPGNAWDSKQTPDLFHVVQRGETLSSIAPRYGARISQLVAINNLPSASRIRIGQKLILPAGAPQYAARAAVVHPGSAPSRPETVAAPVTVALADVSAPDVALAPTNADAPDATDADASTATDTDTDAGTDTDASDDAVGTDQEVAAGSTPKGPSSKAAAAVAIEQQQLAADPSDYTVADDRTILVQEDETIGHYADWLGIKTSEVRTLNHMHHTSAVRVGRRLKLDFSKVSTEQFEATRMAYHRALQEQFFADHQIVSTSEHTVKSGESIWVLAGQRYDVPIWLLRQYNPDLDLARVRPSTRVVIPILASPGA